jgi:23S rRNA pseudouridine1911/1915/1917 synthase
MLPKNVDEKLKKLLENFSRQALHSYKIAFTHPISKQEIALEIPLPKDLQELHDALKNVKV